MHKSHTGILLINLGTPADPSVGSVRQYLAEFLNDPMVIDLPWLVRQILLRVFILPTRPKSSAKAYAAIWDEVRGSPLLFHTQDLAKALQLALGDSYQVEIGMRYGAPSIQGALEKLKVNCQKIVVLPLFPQYSMAATGSAFEKVLSCAKEQSNLPPLDIIKEFYDEPSYIQAQAELLQPFLAQQNYDTVLFSYHSLPVRHIHKTQSQCATSCFKGEPCPTITDANANCYRAQCFATTRLIADQCALPQDKYEVVFQSRLGRTEWVGPELQSTMDKLFQKGVRRLLITSPSFVADCLETLEEIGIRAREHWMALGGESFSLVPCLNGDAEWIKGLVMPAKAGIQSDQNGYQSSL